MRKNKKGISAIVATVLIILITVAAVTIIWAAIIPMISNQLDKGTICVDAVSQVSLPDAGYTCVSSDGSNISIQVRRGAADFDLSDVQVIVTSGGDSTSFVLSDSNIYPAGWSFPGSPGDVTFPGSNEERVYVLDTSAITGTIDKVEIAPIVKVGNAEETCPVSASRTLPVCA